MKRARRQQGAAPRQPRRVDPAVRAGRRARFRRIARACGLIVLLGASVFAGGYGVYYLTSPKTFPLQAVRFDTELRFLREQDLRAALTDHLNAGFWGLEVERIRHALEELAWVDTAAVRRVWPGALRISIREQEALAVWNDEALVNVRGEVFAPDQATWPEQLPHLVGQSGKAAVIVRRMRELDPVFSELGFRVTALELDARESWAVTLDGDVVIALGREDVNARIRRFSRAYESLSAGEERMLAAADLRYPNGFAVRWANESDETN